MIDLICVDCYHEQNFHFLRGEIFNMEVDIILILSDVEPINFSHQTCTVCKNFIFIEFKKTYPPDIIQRIYDGLHLIKRENKLNYKLSKIHEISSTSGEITLRKDENFDILCFEINCDGFLPTRVHLWSINSPCTLLPNLVSNSNNDIGYDCQ